MSSSTPTPDEMTLHNIDQVLGLIKMLCRKNSEMPKFIIKLYTIWMYRTINSITEGKTILPKEDIEVFRALYKDHFAVAEKLIEDILRNAETIERGKIREEAKRAGL